MALNEALDDPRGIAWNLEVFAGLAAAEGHAAAAARLWGHQIVCWTAWAGRYSRTSNGFEIATSKQ